MIEGAGAGMAVLRGPTHECFLGGLRSYRVPGPNSEQFEPGTWFEVKPSRMMVSPSVYYIK